MYLQQQRNGELQTLQVFFYHYMYAKMDQLSVFVWQPVDSTGETCMVGLECRAGSCIGMDAGLDVMEGFGNDEIKVDDRWKRCKDI